MIDFTSCPTNNKMFGGANGKKISIYYNEDYYMLKLPSLAKQNPNMHYSNSVVCEYIGSKIMTSLGFNTQEVVLGTYSIGDKTYDAVACKDFTQDGWTFQDFASMRNKFSPVDSPGYSTELTDILTTFETETSLPQEELTSHFWNLFVADAYIGNWDRHNGNWGFLYNQITDELKLAPVFDCGSSLYPQADTKIINDVLSNNKSAINVRLNVVPTSAIRVNGKRINYVNFMQSCNNPQFLKALSAFQKNCNITEHKSIINSIPTLTSEYKQFLCKMITLRKEEIVDKACKRHGIPVKEISSPSKDSLSKNLLATAKTPIEELKNKETTKQQIHPHMTR